MKKIMPEAMRMAKFSSEVLEVFAMTKTTKRKK